jgi:hypothetical protein
VEEVRLEQVRRNKEEASQRERDAALQATTSARIAAEKVQADAIALERDSAEAEAEASTAGPPTEQVTAEPEADNTGAEQPPSPAVDTNVPESPVPCYSDGDNDGEPDAKKARKSDAEAAAEENAFKAMHW